MKTVRMFGPFVAAFFLVSCCCAPWRNSVQTAGPMATAGPVATAGLSGGVLSVTTAPNGGTVGKLATAYKDPTQEAAHPTLWNAVRKVPDSIEEAPGYHPNTFKAVAAGDSFEPSPTMARVYAGQTTTIWILYK